MRQYRFDLALIPADVALAHCSKRVRLARNPQTTVANPLSPKGHRSTPTKKPE